jgi:hypothetical protein
VVSLGLFFGLPSLSGEIKGAKAKRNAMSAIGARNTAIARLLAQQPLVVALAPFVF